MSTFDPLQPDAPTARDWALEELSKAEYRSTGESWLIRFFGWLEEFISSLRVPDIAGGGSSVVNLLIILAIAGAIVAVVWWVLGPLRRSRVARRTHSVFDDDERPAAHMRADARRHAAAGNWSAAVLDTYRGIIRDLEERDILDDRPGMTAFEAALDTGVAFPDSAAAIRVDAGVFDAIRYGHRDATELEYLHLCDTAAALEGRPAARSGQR